MLESRDIVAPPTLTGAPPLITGEQDDRRRPGPSLRESPLATAAAITVVRIAVGLVVARFALSVIPLRGFPLAPNQPTTSGTAGLFSWDAFFYKSIAAVGYPHVQPAWTPFFPLYAELANVANRISGIGYEGCALAVSWTSLFFATWGLVTLTRKVLPDGAAASRAGWLLCFFPASVFLIAGYAESTYIALFAWALVALWERRPWLAALLACLAGATRPEGLIVALAVVMWSLMQPSRRWLRTIGLGAVSGVGFGAFSLFLWSRFGTPVEEFVAQKYWGRQATWPFHPLVWSLQQVFGDHLKGAAAGNISAVYLLDDASVLAATAGFLLLIAMARRHRDLWWMLVPALVSFLGVISNGPVHGGSPESEARYVLCLVPLYLLTARIRREWVWTATISVSAALAVLFQIVFNLGGWFT